MYKIDELLKNPGLNEKEYVMLSDMRNEFIQEGYDIFLCRKHKEKEADCSIVVVLQPTCYSYAQTPLLFVDDINV